MSFINDDIYMIQLGHILVVGRNKNNVGGQDDM